MLPSISVAARDSTLSRAQVKEVFDELALFHPSVTFKLAYVQTLGDRDKQKSLRLLDKTDFFTREIDQMQLEGLCRIAIHSAKDLPDPLPKGLVVAALTKGVDPTDSLVLQKGETLQTLPSSAVIGTSSDRREANVRLLREDVQFVDIRGTIEERLTKLNHGEIKGLVVAQAALIRLNLTHLNYITLPGKTAPLQGQLAVVARENDKEMLELFRCLNQKKYSI